VLLIFSFFIIHTSMPTLPHALATPAALKCVGTYFGSVGMLVWMMKNEKINSTSEMSWSMVGVLAAIVLFPAA
jgi:hypothetical protein